MNRRLGRSRRWAPTNTGAVPVLSYNYELANVVKDGGNNIDTLLNLGSAGSSLNLAQSTANRKPAWVDNGAPGAATDAGDHLSDGTSARYVQVSPAAAQFGVGGYTIFFAFKKIASTAATTVFAHCNSIAQLRGGWNLNCGSGANGRYFETRSSAGAFHGSYFGSYTLNTPEIWTAKVYANGSDDADASANLRLRVNGTQQGTTIAAGTGAWLWVPTSTWVVQIGSTSVSANTLRVYEARMYRGVLTDAQCLDIERSIGARHGITVA